MSTDNNNRPTDTRSSIVAAVNEVAERHSDDKALALAAEVVNRNEKSREVGSSRHEDKEPDKSNKRSEASESKALKQEDRRSDRQDSKSDDDSGLRKELKTQFKPKAASTDDKTDVVDEPEKGKQDKKADDRSVDSADNRAQRSDQTRSTVAKLPKEVQAEYDNLPDASKQFIARTFKENNDLKAERGRKSYLNDVDKVLAPYAPEMQRIGTSPAQVVNQLLAYSDALANPQYQAAALVKLCQDFNIDLGAVATQLAQQQEELNQVPSYIRTVNDKVDYIVNKFAQREQQEQHAQNQALHQEQSTRAKTTLDTWAEQAGAQHFSDKTVQAKMAELMSNYPALYAGEQFANTGGLNITKAYKDACEALGENEPFRTKPQSNGQRQQSPRTPQPQQRANGQQRGSQRQNMSVRDSLRATIAEQKQRSAHR